MTRLEQIWDLVLESLPGGKTNLNKQPLFMVVEDIFYVECRGTVVTGKVMSGLVRTGDRICIGENEFSVAGVVMFEKLLDYAESGDDCGVLLSDEGVDEEDIDNIEIGDCICNSPEYFLNHDFRIDWEKLTASVSDVFGCEMDKADLACDCSNPSDLVVAIDSMISEMSENELNGIVESLMENKSAKRLSASHGIDKDKIQYVVGIDLGHGETSAAFCALQWDSPESQWEPPVDIEMGKNRKVVPSAITLLPDGRAFIGDKAFDPDILKQANAHVCFKKKPTDIDGEAEKLMSRYMSEVYKLIRENTSGILNDENHVVFIATPSGWDAKSQDIYRKMAENAGLPIYGVTKESRAAYIRGMHNPASGLSKNVRNGAVVFDMGSSTLDFTYLNENISNPIDYGYDCGASCIEKFMYSQKREEEGVREFEERYPDLAACLLYEARNVKEQVYFNPGMKVKKNIHLDEIVDDDNMDITVKFLYQPNELNEQLEKNGYIKQIENAMSDFVSNHIDNAPIYGVFLTGGASRMDFIIPLITKNFGVPKEAISRDQDPSLTISQGVAEVARMDLHTQDADEDLEEMIESIRNENRVYNSFIEVFSHDMCERIDSGMKDLVTTFKDMEEDHSLYELNCALEETINETVNEFLEKASEYANGALVYETRDLTQKISAMVAVYSSQGVDVEVPELEINLDISLQPQMIARIIDSISVKIAKSMKNTTRMWLTGAGAVFGLIGMAAGWLIGSLFNDSEEEKLEKAMTKDLDRSQRESVYDEIVSNWHSIREEIESAIDEAISQNTQIERTIENEVNSMLSEYAKELAQARMLIE